jgi:hypothetical protein
MSERIETIIRKAEEARKKVLEAESEYDKMAAAVQAYEADLIAMYADD